MRKPSSNKLPQDKSSDAPLFSTGAIQKSLETIGKVVAPSALLAALLYYFGWARTSALYSAFGIDQSLVQFTTQDYLLRSTQIALGSVSVILMITLALIWSHYGLNRLKNFNRTWLTRIASLICIASFILVVVSYLLPQSGAIYQSVSVLIPLFWTVGVALLVYGLFTLAQLKTVREKDGKETPFLQTFPEWLRNWSIGVIALLLIVGIFSTTSISAKMQGQAHAAAIKANPSILPAVTVYSQKPLMLEGAGITTETISEDPDTFRYRYQGLRFLVRSGGKYFLLPNLWKKDVSFAIILSESDSIRVEVAP
ncbi:MAG: hypothetical protein Q7T89_07240 [Anaerolineales bacterium]|nr:hypothetical protein [Anaerolineales bacterium]